MALTRSAQLLLIGLSALAVFGSMAAANQLEQDLLDEAEGIFSYMQTIRR